MSKGRVIGHPLELALENCEFRVCPAGRARVLREKKKFVHAFAVGTPVYGMTGCMDKELIQITYNPYKAGYFYRVDTNEPVYAAKLVFLFGDGKVWAKL